MKHDREFRAGCADREIDVEVVLRDDVAVLSSMAALYSDGVETDELHVRLKPFIAESHQFQDGWAPRNRSQVGVVIYGLGAEGN